MPDRHANVGTWDVVPGDEGKPRHAMGVLAREGNRTGEPPYGTIWRRIGTEVRTEYQGAVFEDGEDYSYMGEYDPVEDIVTLHSRDRMGRVRGMRSKFFWARFKQVPAAADQGNSGAWG